MRSENVNICQFVKHLIIHVYATYGVIIYIGNENDDRAFISDIKITGEAICVCPPETPCQHDNAELCYIEVKSIYFIKDNSS